MNVTFLKLTIEAHVMEVPDLSVVDLKFLETFDDI